MCIDMSNKSAIVGVRMRNIIVNTLLSLYCIITVIPLWYVFNNAFKKEKYIYSQPYYLPIEAMTFKNITEAYKLMNYSKLFLNSAIYLVVSCGVMIVLGALAGFGIGTSESKLLRRIYVVILLCITIPFQLYMIPLVVVLRDLNILNSYIGTICAYVVVSLPFVVFIYTGFVKTIPKELYVAAAVDGCGPMMTLLKVYLPLLKPVTGTVLILRGVSTWNSEIIPMVTIFEARRINLVQGVYTFISTNITRWDLIFGSALLTTLPITIMFLALQKAFVKGLTAGSVKG
jgi:raffinose/stachyose/melibiose transport system permease protein